MQASWQRLIYANKADFSAYASSAIEGTLLGGPNLLPTLLPWCLEPNGAYGKAWRVTARGVLSTTGTPTIIFQARLGPTAGSATISQASVGASAAITTLSGVTNVGWELELTIVTFTPGVGSGNCTLSCGGFVRSGAGFATPFAYLLVPAIASPQTWTQTVDGGVTNYLNVSATWSASSASNTITVKQLLVEELS